MNLDVFVKESLVQLTQAVNEAHEQTGGLVAPAGLKSAGDAKGKEFSIYGSRPVFLAEFDLAISVDREAGVEGGVKGGMISVLSGSIDSQLKEVNSKVSRLKFSVPVVYQEPGK